MLAGCLALCALFVEGACHSSSSGNEPTAPEDGVSATITPEAGGSLTSADGRLTITFPPGAVAAPTVVSVAALPAGDLERARGAIRYRLLPEGLTFAASALPTVSIKLSASEAKAALPVTSEVDPIAGTKPAPSVALYTISDAGKTFEFLPTSRNTPAADGTLVVSANTPHFSVVGIDLYYQWLVSPQKVELLVGEWTDVTATLRASLDLYESGGDPLNRALDLTLDSFGIYDATGTPMGANTANVLLYDEDPVLHAFWDPRAAGKGTVLKRLDHAYTYFQRKIRVVCLKEGTRTVRATGRIRSSPTGFTNENTYYQWNGQYVEGHGDTVVTCKPHPPLVGYVSPSPSAGDTLAAAFGESFEASYDNGVTKASPDPVVHSACATSTSGPGCTPSKSDWTSIVSSTVAMVNGVQAAVDAMFNHSLYPCGLGKVATTVCPKTVAPFPAGPVVIVTSRFSSPVDLASKTRNYQLGFVFDQDNVASNNYVPSSKYPSDFFKDTDLWYEADYAPLTGWSLKVTDARSGGAVLVPTNARVILQGSSATLVVPASEFKVADPKFRVTTFEHNGDYGLKAPYDWSGSVQPPVAAGLRSFPPPLSKDKRFPLEWAPRGTNTESGKACAAFGFRCDTANPCCIGSCGDNGVCQPTSGAAICTGYGGACCWPRGYLCDDAQPCCAGACDGTGVCN